MQKSQILFAECLVDFTRELRFFPTAAYDPPEWRVEKSTQK